MWSWPTWNTRWRWQQNSCQLWVNGVMNLQSPSRRRLMRFSKMTDFEWMLMKQLFDYNLNDGHSGMLDLEGVPESDVLAVQDHWTTGAHCQAPFEDFRCGNIPWFSAGR